jgi:hypothetical protein
MLNVPAMNAHRIVTVPAGEDGVDAAIIRQNADLYYSPALSRRTSDCSGVRQPVFWCAAMCSAQNGSPHPSGGGPSDHEGPASRGCPGL